MKKRIIPFVIALLLIAICICVCVIFNKLLLIPFFQNHSVFFHSSPKTIARELGEPGRIVKREDGCSIYSYTIELYENYGTAELCFSSSGRLIYIYISIETSSPEEANMVEQQIIYELKQCYGRFIGFYLEELPHGDKRSGVSGFLVYEFGVDGNIVSINGNCFLDG